MSGYEEDMCPNCVTPWKCNGPHEMGEEQFLKLGFDVRRLLEDRKPVNTKVESTMSNQPVDIDVDRLRHVAQRALADGAWWDRGELRSALDEIADTGDDTAADATFMWEARPAKILALLDRLDRAERQDRVNIWGRGADDE